MKKLFPLLLIIPFCVTAYAQKQRFDVVSFIVPKGWQQKQNDGSVQLLATDNGTGAYVMAIITNASPSTASAIENFNNRWKAAIKDQIQLDGDPVMQPSSSANGWQIESGNASYTDNGAKGNVALLTATGGGQTISVVIMTNATQYEKELAAFLGSLELAKLPQNENGNMPTPAGETGKISLEGLWTDYMLESNGFYGNGMPQYTGGYMRKEYAFYPDGTYLFRNKQWITKTRDILFIYEAGTYTLNGNRVTLVPRQGKGGWWAKEKGQTTLWGGLVKGSDYKPEKVTYSFEIKSLPGSQAAILILRPGKPTQRDGGRFNATDEPYEFRYSFREKYGSLIDNPPGIKTGFENKPVPSAAISPASDTATVNAANSPIAGKTWEGTSAEKFTGAGATNGFNTGGFSTGQYRFNADGTYRFVNVRASYYTNTKTLEYETGTYSVSGNQLTINPTKGQNEEWSKVGKTSNGNSDVTNRAINETWGEKLKSSSRKLEKYTYTFSVGKNGDKVALVLQRNGRTEREGEGKISYFNETTPERSVTLPGGIK